MKTNITFVLLLITGFLMAQEMHTTYEPSKQFPFGRKNPIAPEQLSDFDMLIGLCDCASESRNADGSWQEPVSMTWKFKYIMNGMAIQDETLKSDGRHSGSIRQFNKDSLKWYVHYFSTGSVTPVLPSWEGTKKTNGNIVLYREQKAPNGMDGYYRLTFYDISENGYKWVGEWVDKDESTVFPTWKIQCVKRKD
ncbi:hypothetical protein ACFQ1M_00905 [Sungkyunkwania multivorans]|uniref:Uncharacterized protein n=1 Tax=Sungkyunkwania multivorans TaxID=1173618 RepID=A0ABW3CV65_9FLAO